MPELTLGLKPALQFNTVEALRRVWELADEGGFDSCWAFDHFAALGPDRSGDIFEAWTMLAAMAQALAGSGERYSLRVIAEHADVWINASQPGTPPEELARLSEVLDRHCADIGRDPATIRRAAQLRLPSDPDEAVRMVEHHLRVGFTEIIIMIFEGGPAGIAAAESAVDLLPKLRALA